MVELQKHMESACSIAVKNASDRILEELQKCISEDYYMQYSPNYYERTYTFYKSAVAKLLNDHESEIGISDLYMNYEYPAKYKLLNGDTGHWTGADQTNMAASGYHGTYYIQTEGRFWDSFIEFCEKNAINILKEELKKQGINVK